MQKLAIGLSVFACMASMSLLQAADFAGFASGLRDGKWNKAVLEYEDHVAIGTPMLLIPSPLNPATRIEREAFRDWCRAKLDANKLDASAFQELALREFPGASTQQIDALYGNIDKMAQAHESRPVIRLPNILAVCASNTEELRAALQLLLLRAALRDEADRVVESGGQDDLQILSRILRHSPNTVVLQNYVQLLNVLSAGEDASRTFDTLAKGEPFIAPFSLEQGDSGDGRQISLMLPTINPVYRYKASLIVSTFDILEGLRSGEVIGFARAALDDFFRALRQEVRRRCESDEGFFQRYRNDIDLLMSRMLQVDSANVVATSVGWYSELLRVSYGQEEASEKVLGEELVSMFYVILDDTNTFVLGSKTKNYYSMFQRTKRLAQEWERSLVNGPR